MIFFLLYHVYHDSSKLWDRQVWANRPDDITKTCLYNFDPRKPHFYIVKLEFKGVYIIIIPMLFRKSVGDIVIASVRLSVHPSVPPSVRYIISSQNAGQNPTKFDEWLAYTSGACKSTFIFGPAPRGPGEGSKGQILTIFNFKVNL